MEVLSLAKRIAELDRYEALRAQLLGYCSRGVRTAARTLIRFAETAAVTHHDLLQLEAARIDGSHSETELRGACEQVERVLEEHQRQGEAHVTALRDNLNSTARVLQSVLEQMAGSGAAHHEALEADLEHLREIQRINELDLLKRELNATAEQIAARLVGMRREYQLIVTQLRDEIRILHQELEERSAARGAHSHQGHERRQPETSSTGVQEQSAIPTKLADTAYAPEDIPSGMRRPEFEEVMKVKTEHGEQYSLVVILLSNLADLFTQFEPAIVLSLMDLSARRIIDAFTGNPFWIRWEDDCFLVCTHFRGVAASSWADDLADRLSGNISVSGVNLPVQVMTATVDSNVQEKPEAMLARASALIRSLRSAV